MLGVLCRFLFTTGYPQCIRFLNVGDTVELMPAVSFYLVGAKDLATAVLGAPLPPPAAPVIISNQSSLVPIELTVNATAPVFSLAPSGTRQCESI